ncbi:MULTISPECIES: hypothetical protein [unclassified Enterococcus]|jgi:hypothetical protein|uniref:hypothetical protein n=1 Tax=unclassified Enterococcus TaxID=2608891 RepID=UPI0006B94FFB|nr:MULTISPECIES: hypothetical protein [unclassified Enterococcus]KPG71065.1 hypothetical protein AEQ18_05405 [Enterococcus sp. RIT-PI-f]
MEQINIGQTYRCQPVGTKKHVEGTIEKLYLNTALIIVTACEEEDKEWVFECNHRMIVTFNNIHAAIHAA